VLDRSIKDLFNDGNYLLEREKQGPYRKSLSLLNQENNAQSS